MSNSASISDNIIAKNFDINSLRRMNDLCLSVLKSQGNSEIFNGAIAYPTNNEINEFSSRLSNLLKTPYAVDVMVVVLPALIEAIERTNSE